MDRLRRKSTIQEHAAAPLKILLSDQANYHLSTSEHQKNDKDRSTSHCHMMPVDKTMNLFQFASITAQFRFLCSPQPAPPAPIRYSDKLSLCKETSERLIYATQKFHCRIVQNIAFCCTHCTVLPSLSSKT